MNLSAIDAALNRTGYINTFEEEREKLKHATLERIETALNLRFSEEQKAVIVHDNQPLAVISCAGSGKTTVMIARLLYRELYFEVPPSEMLSISFSKRAVNELEERYKAARIKLGMGAGQPTFKTFHALFYQYVKRIIPNVKFVSESQYTYDLMKLINNNGGYEKKDILNAILDYRSSAINNSLSYDGVTSSMDENSRLQAVSEFFDDSTYHKVIERYTELKRSNNEIDFDDMLVYMYERTVKNPDSAIIASFQSTFYEVSIDEYQDISDIIIRIMDVFVADKNHLTVIGDDDQSIYGFRGSKDYYILNFTYRYVGAKNLFLGDNYRCPANILMPFVPSIERNKNRLEKTLRASKEGGEIEFIDTSSSKEELINKIIEVYNAGGSLDNMAVLVRLNLQKAMYADLLAARQIPVDIGDKYSTLQANKIYRNIHNIIKAIKAQDNTVFTQCGWMFTGIPYQGIQSYKKMDAANWYMDAVELNKWSLQKDVLEHIRIIHDSTDAKDIIRRVWVLTKGYYLRLEAQGYGSYQQTLSIVKHVAANAEGITYAQYNANEMRKEMFLSVYTGTPNTIKLHTIHAVKGMEFDYVFMVGVDGDAFPKQNVINDYNRVIADIEKELATANEHNYPDIHKDYEYILKKRDQYVDEERRTFYVGGTRAKKKLVIGYGSKNVSMFMRELDHPLLHQKFESTNQ